jgi:hypothetical protein
MALADRPERAMRVLPAEILAVSSLSNFAIFSPSEYGYLKITRQSWTLSEEGTGAGPMRTISGFPDSVFEIALTRELIEVLEENMKLRERL